MLTFEVREQSHRCNTQTAVAHGVPFAISEPVYTAAGLVPNCEKKIMVPFPGRAMAIAV